MAAHNHGPVLGQAELRAAAQALDRQGAKGGRLHGLPVSLKECCGLAGRDSTIGSAKRIDVTSPADAVIVEVLLGVHVEVILTQVTLYILYR